MRTSIKAELEENGYVIIDDFLTPEEINELKEAGNSLCEEAPKEGIKVFSTLNGAKAQNKDDYFLKSADKVSFFFEEGALNDKGELVVEPAKALNKVGHALHVENDLFRKITFSNRVKECCWQLDYKRPAVVQSMYIYKNPGIGGEVKSHQDSTYITTEPHSTLGFWIPLEDATIENGCLRFIKGSHKSGTHLRYKRNPDTESKELLIYDSSAPVYPLSSFISVPVSKGSCVLIHGQVVHRSELNKSNQSRHAYTFHVVETENTKYLDDNWLQLPEGKSFEALYETK